MWWCCNDLHDRIYGRTLSAILENIENYLLNCFDAVGLLLLIKVSHRNYNLLGIYCTYVSQLGTFVCLYMWFVVESHDALGNATPESSSSGFLLRPNIPASMASLQASLRFQYEEHQGSLCIQLRIICCKKKCHRRPASTPLRIAV